MWVISDSWLLIPATTAYYQWRQPILTVSLEVEKEDYFGDVTLTILASSQGKEKGIAVKSSLGALNYPVYINET